jgi:hypothetical protein
LLSADELIRSLCVTRRCFGRFLTQSFPPAAAMPSGRGPIGCRGPSRKTYHYAGDFAYAISAAFFNIGV